MTPRGRQNRPDAGWMFDNSFARLPEAFYVRLTLIVLQEIFVGVTDRLPIQSQMAGDIANGHDSAQLIIVTRQSCCYAQVWMKQLPILDADTMTMGTKPFVLVTMNPDRCGGEF